MRKAARPRLSAGCVVVRDTAEAVLFLLLRAYRNWDFPKGAVEQGEQPLAAALRETAEETGIADLEFPWGDEWFETEPYSGGKVARYYLARAKTPRVVLGVNPALGKPEHHEYRWVDHEHALALAPPRLKPVIGWAAETIGARPGSPSE